MLPLTTATEQMKRTSRAKVNGAENKCDPGSVSEEATSDAISHPPSKHRAVRLNFRCGRRYRCIACILKIDPTVNGIRVNNNLGQLCG